ncbi:2-oxoacid:acceptor oxidoreductase family protein [Candidatus Pacearchaeota archaeon]|nr:2-oxoacid:acceptor oxidoreductase family protein [Candidatus Pacearchaeota archaeon]
MKYTILFGGEAGQGPNILTNILGQALVKQGYHVFYSRDYQSLIRGGHNFNVLTFSDKPIHSNESKIDILVSLDEDTETMHKDSLKKEAVVLKGHDENMYYAGRLFKLLGLNFEVLEQELKELEKRFEENMKEAKKGYEDERDCVCQLKHGKGDAVFMNGNQGISEGAVKSGLDIYYAYPMTPATPVLGELAEVQEEKNILVLELENEISVINAGIGSAMTGAKVMVGTSGGGFDLMTEGISLAGMAEVPMVIYLSQRPGPATGVATYTAQGDLNIARHSGHGEFNRIVLAPGNPKECQELISQAFYLSQIFAIPSIIISDKHLGESFYTIEEKPKITHSRKLASMMRYNSYEKDKEGSATENPEIIKENIEARIKKNKEIEKETEKVDRVNVYGKKHSKNVIVSWGSTKGAILDAIEDLDVEFIQVLYIEPFPDIKKELEKKNVILIENNATGMLGELIAEKTGIFIEDKNKILKYDGRPFFHDELKKEIEGRLGK